ncbi:MAG: PDZ domain-containing protein [bacterium]
MHNPVVAVRFRELTERPVEAVRIGYSHRGYSYASPPKLDEDRYYYYMPEPEPDPAPYWNWRWDDKKDCFPGIGVYGKLSSSGGALIEDVLFNGPAYRVGIRRGDKIVSVNGEHVGSFYDLKELVGRMEPGDYAALGYLRFGRHHSATARIEIICPP